MQRQNSKVSRSNFGCLLKLIPHPRIGKAELRVLSGPSQNIRTEGVWSLPPEGHAHESLSTCDAFPEGTIFTRGDWLPLRGKKIATENQPRLEVKQNDAGAEKPFWMARLGSHVGEGTAEMALGQTADSASASAPGLCWQRACPREESAQLQLPDTSKFSEAGCRGMLSGCGFFY